MGYWNGTYISWGNWEMLVNVPLFIGELPKSRWVNHQFSSCLLVKPPVFKILHGENHHVSPFSMVKSIFYTIFHGEKHHFSHWMNQAAPCDQKSRPPLRWRAVAQARAYLPCLEEAWNIGTISHRIHMDPCMPYMVTFTISIPKMLAYIPYMDPMGMGLYWEN